MASSLLLVAVANLLFVVACGTVGVRLLLLSRRTQEQPEFYLGLGFCCLVLGLPILGLSGLGRLAAGDLNLFGIALGMALLWLGITTQSAFTWKAFRPEAAWGEAIVLGIGAAEAVIVGGALDALGAAASETPSFEAARTWMFWLRIPLLVAYGWSALESLHQHVLARRRGRLGIGDPVVTNRLLVWGMAAVVGFVSVVASSAMHLRGQGPLADPLAAATLAVTGFAGAVLLYLAFLPPLWYLRMIARRGATEARAGG